MKHRMHGREKPGVRLTAEEWQSLRYEALLRRYHTANTVRMLCFGAVFVIMCLALLIEGHLFLEDRTTYQVVLDSVPILLTLEDWYLKWTLRVDQPVRVAITVGIAWAAFDLARGQHPGLLDYIQCVAGIAIVVTGIAGIRWALE